MQTDHLSLLSAKESLKLDKLYREKLEKFHFFHFNTVWDTTQNYILREVNLESFSKV